MKTHELFLFALLKGNAWGECKGNVWGMYGMWGLYGGGVWDVWVSCMGDVWRMYGEVSGGCMLCFLSSSLLSFSTLLSPLSMS